jgi:hypothetical protein
VEGGVLWKGLALCRGSKTPTKRRRAGWMTNSKKKSLVDEKHF